MANENKKKIRITVIEIVIIVLILFVPIPKNVTFDYGTAFTLNSLTYKVVFWNAYSKSEKPYTETELVLPPKNFSSVNDLFYSKEQRLRSDGYGSESVTVTVEKIDENNRIWIKELSDDINAIDNVVITFDNIKEYGIDITPDEIKEGVTIKISYDGVTLELYPGLFGRIYSIELVGTNNNEVAVNSSFTEDTVGSQPSLENSTQETTSSTPTISDNTDSVNSQNTATENNSDISTNSTTSHQDDDFVPLFWNQKMYADDDYYDTISNIHIPYRVIEPLNYNPNEKYPVILFLHGAGYRFNSPEDVDFNKLQVSTLASSFIFNYKWTTEAIIIAPQISKNDWWDFGQNSNGPLDAAMRIFEKVTNEYSCDSSRYYVTGGSMGGYATWQVATKYKDVFAAAMPMCGWWTPQDASRLADMPIRIIHGTADTTVSVDKSKIMYNAIKTAGGQKVVISLYEGAEHDVWREAYYDEETWNWLFAQKKK